MYKIDRRAALILPAAAGLVALPLRTRAQNFATLPDVLSSAGSTFREVAISHSEEFSQFFNAVWQLRTTLSFAAVMDGSEDALKQILSNAERRLREDSPDGISGEESNLIKRNSMRFQNEAIALSTDQKSGEVRIESGILYRVRELLCPLYPFC